MTQTPAAATHGESASAILRQRRLRASSGAESSHRNMTSSSSPYPSVSPSPESTAGHGLPASAPGPREPGRQTASQDGKPLQPALDAGFSPDPATFDSSTDGLTDRLFRSKKKGPIAAIFIHAGAGFHSTLNEHVHLEACSDAARLAMKFLKAGGTAVDAVEAAIKCLEDKEITNAGFGSNLTIDGIVEGDATIVDHLGRSGACGSVQMVRNPISLARLIYDRSNVPLSLRRIPPNILVGHGAARFAQEYGMCLVPHQHLISRGAQERFQRWRQDLMNAEAALRKQTQAAATVSATKETTAAENAASLHERTAGVGAERHETPGARQDHQAADAGAVASSLSKGDARAPQVPQAAQPAEAQSSQTAHSKGTVNAAAAAAATASSSPAADSRPLRTSTPHPKRPRLGDYNLLSNDDAADRKRRSRSSGDGSCTDSPADGDPTNSDSETVGATAEPHGPLAGAHVPDELGVGNVFAGVGLHDHDTDVITDTIGAIAIDLRGNIAAGSSSGGIGMKHSGRIGPAALVGVGSAVVPADPKDSSGACVAAVTSGTGEHMATTMASHTCAERLYHNRRRAPGGLFEAEYDEDAIMKSFVADDFMNHPGVKNQISRGAIGVMAAKKTNKGIYFYFAHNTDSFALASLSSNEQDPLVVMSRLGPHESVARGGRKIKGN